MGSDVAASKEEAAKQDTNKWVRRMEPQSGSVYFTNRFLNESVWELPDGAVELPELESYNNHRVMSLDEFVRSPIVRDTLHNGAVFQLLGISNYTIPTGPESTSA